MTAVDRVLVGNTTNRRTACGQPVLYLAEPNDADDGCGWGRFCPRSPRFVGDPFTNVHPQWAPFPGQCNACFLYQHGSLCEIPNTCTCPTCH